MTATPQAIGMFDTARAQRPRAVLGAGTAGPTPDPAFPITTESGQ